MKKLVLVFAAVLISLPTIAQKRNGVTGPRYKNYTTDKHVDHSADKSTILYVGSKKKGLTGPRFKNHKPWQGNSESYDPKVAVAGSTKKGLLGPSFKNFRSGQKSNNNESVVITIGNERSELTGPEFKNYKPKATDTKKKRVNELSDRNKFTGPKYKNYKIHNGN